MGDFGEIIAFLIFITFALLSSRKKKKKTGQTAQVRSAGQARQAGRPKVDLKELERMLREPELVIERIQQAAEPAKQPEPLTLAEPTSVATREPATAWAEGLERRPQSAENLDGSHVASHQRFHDLYVEPLEQVTAEQQAAVLTPSDLRNAIVWREILGPPASMK